MQSITPGTVPTHYDGPSYLQVMSDVSTKRSTGLYLEIGVSTGLLMRHIRCRHAVGVDPSYALCENVMTGKSRLSLLNMTSDAFFRDERALAVLDDEIDLAFLDGMHTFEFLLRDFFNTEKRCHRNALIVLHDCLPLNSEMAHRNMAESLRIGKSSRFPDYWTGDVWKLVPILKIHRPDLRLVYVGAPPTGLVFITNVDPASDVLEANYLDIVAKFAEVPNTMSEIAKMYDGLHILPPLSIMSEFDHSLFFRS